MTRARAESPSCHRERRRISAVAIQKEFKISPRAGEAVGSFLTIDVANMDEDGIAAQRRRQDNFASELEAELGDGSRRVKSY